MKHSPRAFTSIIKTAACAALFIGTVAHAQVNPTGTYTWTQPGRNGGPDRTNTLTLKFADGKLTGEYTAPAGGRGGGGGGGGGAAPMPLPISDGKVDGSMISFNVVRELPNGGNSITNKYAGKISGDTITGTIEGPAFGGRRGGGGGGGGGGAGGGGGGAPATPPAPREWTATKSK